MQPLVQFSSGIDNPYDPIGTLYELDPTWYRSTTPRIVEFVGFFSWFESQSWESDLTRSCWIFRKVARKTRECRATGNQTGKRKRITHAYDKCQVPIIIIPDFLRAGNDQSRELIPTTRRMRRGRKNNDRSARMSKKAKNTRNMIVSGESNWAGGRDAMSNYCNKVLSNSLPSNAGTPQKELYRNASNVKSTVDGHHFQSKSNALSAMQNFIEKSFNNNLKETPRLEHSPFSLLCPAVAYLWSFNNVEICQFFVSKSHRQQSHDLKIHPDETSS